MRTIRPAARKASVAAGTETRLPVALAENLMVQWFRASRFRRQTLLDSPEEFCVRPESAIGSAD